MIAALAGLCFGALGQTSDDPVPPPGAAPAADATVVPIIRLNGMVSRVMQDRLERQAREARNDGARTIVLEMDTWGGDAIAALEMSDFVKNLRPRVVAWVNPKAISAGAMISLAADDIVMAERSRIGDCMPISGSGQTLGAAEREKIETVIREEFRDSARRHGYPMALCVAMVTRGPAVYEIQHRENSEVRYIPGTELGAYGLSDAEAAAAPVKPPPKPEPADESADEASEPFRKLAEQFTGQSAQKPEPDAPITAESAPTVERPYDKGKWRVLRRVVGEKQLLTMSQSEAMDYGFAKRIVSDPSGLAAYLGVEPSRFRVVEANWSEEMVAFLTHPLMRGLLTIVMLMGLYSEMQAPGLGFPGGIAVVAFLLLVGAPYLAGLANMLEILAIVLGLLLLAVEVFVLPGFGVSGVTGLILIFVGLLMTFVPEGRHFTPPDLPGTWEALRNGLLTLIVSLALACVGFFFLTKFFGQVPLINRLVLGDEQKPMSAAFGNRQTDTATLAPVRVGDEGESLAELHPSGRAQFGDQPVDVVSVVSVGGWIEAGRKIRVVEVHGNRIVVEEA